MYVFSLILEYSFLDAWWHEHESSHIVQLVWWKEHHLTPHLCIAIDSYHNLRLQILVMELR